MKPDSGKTMPRCLLLTALWGAALLAGCDASREELEATRGKLAAMTTERDGLQKQLEAARAELLAANKAAQAAADPNTAKGQAVKHELHDGHFESNKSGLKGDASFLAITNQKAFDQVFGTAAVMGGGQHFVPKDALAAKIVVAVIKRGTTPWEYAVEKVTADEGVLYVQYKATAKGSSGSATLASPLLLSVDKGPYAAVFFIENGKRIGMAIIGN